MITETEQIDKGGDKANENDSFPEGDLHSLEIEDPDDVHKCVSISGICVNCDKKSACDFIIGFATLSKDMPAKHIMDCELSIYSCDNYPGKDDDHVYRNYPKKVRASETNISVGECATNTEINNTNDEKDVDKKDVDERVNKFMEEFHEHGLGCGNEIAKLAKEIHPDAIAIIPLYRSCIVLEQSDGDKKDGSCILYCYADPHWLGEEIDVENLRKKDFYTKFIIQGHRDGPIIYLENTDKDSDDKGLEEGSKNYI